MDGLGRSILGVAWSMWMAWGGYKMVWSFVTRLVDVAAAAVVVESDDGVGHNERWKLLLWPH